MILGGTQRFFFNHAANFHSWALAITCAALLSFNFSSSRVPAITSLFAESASAESEMDAALQKVANAALTGREGAVIVMDAQTGRIRAVVNPQLAFATALMPGSTMKPFTALAALRSGLIAADTRTVCPGRFKGRGFSVACVHDDHLPPFTPSQAISYSCNYYFATLGERLGRDQLIATLRDLGFAQPAGRIENEATGILRPCERENTARVRIANHVATQSDCRAREAIGESDHIQVTPIQLLTAYAALLNGGRLLEPQISPAKNSESIERGRIGIAPQHRTIIAEGMRGAVRYGTARRARLETLPLTILGKTGTALPAKGFRTNGWFIGFVAPFENNRQVEASRIDLAVLVLVSHAHGSEAASIARPIFETYANELNRRGAETQRTLLNDEQPGQELSASPHLPISASPIKVHLVHDNFTQELSLEDYVLGVMRAEGTMETEPEALKALAIAVRTYAAKNIGRHAKDGYDFCSTTHCQRFISVRSPTVRESTIDNGALANARASDTNLIAAVRATDGQVLMDERGQPIDAYFGASCGGETANIGTLWGITPPEYLRGVRDEYCDVGPHAKWTDTISRTDLWRALHSDARTDVGSRLDQAIVSKRDETGRAEFITLEGERRKVVRGWDFKIIVGRALGWNVLKSSRFEVSRSGSNFVFRGSGFGHGLGLCQEGAHVMAARGMSYQKILEKYFPGTRVLPRGGNVSLARPFKTGTQNEKDKLVASATDEYRSVQSSLTHRTPCCADASPALGGWAKIMRRPPTVFSNHGSSYLAISSEHFHLAYPANVDRRDANQVLSTLESSRSDFLRRASSAVSVEIPTLDIRLNESTGNFTARTGQPWWAAAATKRNRIELQPLGILKRRGVLMTTLRHELAHVIIDAVSNQRAPRWLGEGFAIYLAGEGGQFSNHFKRAILSTAELEERLARPTSQQEMKSLYAQAYLIVTQTIQTEGEASVWKKLATD